MADHTVVPGDCFSSLAKDNNYYNYLTLYNHPDNATIKGTRTNPNFLNEGDTVKIPDKRQKKVALTLDKEKKFEVDRKKTKLRLKVVDVELKPISPSSCKLTVGTDSLSKMSGGLMELEINPTEKAGTLNFKLPAAAKVDTGQNEPGTVEKVKDALTPEKTPTNPPEIEVRDFIDELPDYDKDPIEFKVALQIGFLEPHTEVRGGLRRLNNLGCKIPLPDAKTADDDATKAVVKSYQLWKAPKAVPSGLIADLLTGLETAHDTI
jgi:hypothetical protein